MVKLTVRISEDLHERILAAARADTRSLNGEAIVLIEEALAARHEQE